jgi:hypothetical protein
VLRGLSMAEGYVSDRLDRFAQPSVSKRGSSWHFSEAQSEQSTKFVKLCDGRKSCAWKLVALLRTPVVVTVAKPESGSQLAVAMN